MKKSFVLSVRIALILLLALSLYGCAATTKGAVRDDTTVTGTGEELAMLAAAQGQKGPKLRIGVVSFENKTPSKAFGIGESAADILATILQKSGRFIIVAYQDMKHIIEQQKFSTSGLVNPDTAVKMGQILGLNAIVSGVITAYSETVEGKDFILYQEKEQVARVTVDYRIVDVTAGMQITSDSGAGIYRKKTSQVMGMGSRSTYDTDLRDGALRDALTKATLNIVKQLGTKKWAGRIAAVKERTQLFINAGQKSGLNVGDSLLVYRPGEDIIDPVTKVKIGMDETMIGEIKITNNALGDTGDMSIAKPVSGNEFRAGDIVRFKE